MINMAWVTSSPEQPGIVVNALTAVLADEQPWLNSAPGCVVSPSSKPAVEPKVTYHNRISPIMQVISPGMSP